MTTYDLSPLCATYDTPMYTQKMQALPASTTEPEPEPTILYGDINSDGRVNTLDLIIPRQHLTGWDVPRTLPHTISFVK